jgi:hypothetical protein
MRTTVSLVLGVLLSCSLAPRTSGEDKPTTLAANEKKFLDRLMKEFVFDPKGPSG